MRLYLIAALLSTCGVVYSHVEPLNSDNIDAVLNGHHIVFVSFSADWCRFSQLLRPIFEEASVQLKNEGVNQVLFASVDCDRQPAIAQRFKVNKYPTLKLFRYGQLVKKEYRGQRSVEAFKEFVRKQLESSAVTLQPTDALNDKLDTKKRSIIAYLTKDSGDEYENVQKLASTLREDCAFYIGAGDWVRSRYPAGSTIMYRPSSENSDIEFTGPLAHYEHLHKWASDHCVPLIREITFENAEELTEEGVPFLILFRRPGDEDAEKAYADIIHSELLDLKSSVNFLMADGKKFAHPLYHLGKTERDLPVIAIDSFRHMYLFSSYADLKASGRLRQFVLDFNSGKLHREFHHGPDPTVTTAPPQSVFKQLKPSDNRYTLLGRDEL